MKTYTIQNPKKTEQLKGIVNEQIEFFHTTGKQKYSLMHITRMIRYKDRARIRNTIKNLIGIKLYKQMFGGLRGDLPSLTLEQLEELVFQTGMFKTGIPGEISEQGKKKYLEALSGSMDPSRVNLEVACGVKYHPKFNVFVSNLKTDGKWCKKCSNESKTFTMEMVIERGLDPINLTQYYLDENPDSFKYKMKNRGNTVPSQVKLKWICENGHSQEKRYADVGRKGCKRCDREDRATTYQAAQEMARKNSHELDMTPEEFEAAIKQTMDKNIKPGRYRLRWRCTAKKSHTWLTTYDNMKKGAVACPHCDEGYHEALTRRLMKKIFGVDFIKTKCNEIFQYYFHPSSHLDGYAVFTVGGIKIRVGFEYNRYQHYVWPNIHQRLRKRYDRTKQIDREKVNASKDQGVILIVIPYTLYKRDYGRQAVEDHVKKSFLTQVRNILKDPFFQFNLKDVKNLGLNRFIQFV